MKSRAAVALALVLGLAANTTADAAINVESTVVGGQGQGDGNNQLDTPLAITIGPAGDLYIADGLNGRVQRVTVGPSAATTEITTVLGGTVSAALNLPYDMAFDANGVMYIAESGANRVLRVVLDDPANPIITTVAGQSTLGAGDVLNRPRGLSFAPDGSLYIVDAFGGRVRKLTLDTNGVPQTTTTVVTATDVGAGFWIPQGIVVDDNGVMYLAAAGEDHVYRITFDGTDAIDSLVIAAGPGTPFALSSPNGLALDLDGSLYVAGVTAHTVQRLTLDGSGVAIAAETVAGQDGEGDGPGQLSNPNGVAVSAAGALFINDAGNDRVLGSYSDNTGPVLNAPDYGTIREDVPFTVRFGCDDDGAGIDTCTATRNGVPIFDGTVFSPNQPGIQTIVVTGVDTAGNTTTRTWTLTIYGSRELTGDYAQLTGAEAATARLYMAAFKREPEIEGFNYWTNRIREGTSMQAVADYFVTSPELRRLNGDLTNDDLVDLLYDNVMQRAPEPTGKAYWIGQLEGGMSRARMLLLFSDTSEFRTLSNSD